MMERYIRRGVERITTICILESEFLLNRFLPKKDNCCKFGATLILFAILMFCDILCTGNTPERFGEVLKKALAKEGPAVIINAWNEWTEGMALLPDTQYGTGYLDTIAKITTEMEK